ncbi:hypothetical protein D1AOALGA4SA_3343 [Olavius algarvensis Delta 1 endosymbiont]|nr:hypothetical protein D1AOALGA4SA_3343 [Olavius algarvensis Delta 1 endosymbiont]
MTGFFSLSARSPFGRRPFYPDDPVDPVRSSFKDENPFLFLPYFELRFIRVSNWPFVWPAAALTPETCLPRRSSPERRRDT